MRGISPALCQRKIRTISTMEILPNSKTIWKKILHQLLRAKLAHFWKPIEPLTLIDLGYDIFIVKFNLKASMNKVLTEGPWFVTCHFLFIQKWEPNFVPAESKLAIKAIWIRLPQLPTEFYDKVILEQGGNSVGKLLKIETCTSSTLRGRYARICVQVPLDIPVTTAVTIGTHNQPILYEGEGILCKGCGKIGHTLRHCPFTPKINEANNPTNPNPTSTTTGKAHAEDSLWQTIPFRQNKKGTHRGNHLPRPFKASPEHPTIQVRQYIEATSTFLDLEATASGGGSPKN
ncbi:uncharacterized protein [Nicotiana sylvestris]|uniref:uncharacterized protein n=1 Tax=Nicotiana sylvestris TaxID=4096 RepID=UPI00388C6BC9